MSSGYPLRCLKWMTISPIPVALMAISVVLPAGAQSFSVLHSFTGANDGFYPQGLAIDRTGNLYGATLGGSHNQGAIFKLTNRGSIWTFSSLYSFAGGTDGAFPVGVTLGADGRVYGTTNVGGGSSCGGGGCGTVFRAAPPPTVCRSTRCPWLEQVLYAFQGDQDGAQKHPWVESPYPAVGFAYTYARCAIEREGHRAWKQADQEGFKDSGKGRNI